LKNHNLGPDGRPCSEDRSRIEVTIKEPCVYILASKRNGTLYVGVTSDIGKRVWEHKNDVVDGFTSRYGVHLLVYVEPHDTMEAAMTREKQIKKWRRAWKLELVEERNPQWRDLYEEILA
jgi:putative endonuclease